MNDFLQVLIRRYRADLDASQTMAESSSGPDDARAALQQSMSSLLVAESAQKKITLCEHYPDHPRQIVIIGPTQVGKSSVVNLLLEQELAEASAKAGFTVHCQGYAVDVASDDIAADSWHKTYFNGFESREQSMLDRQLLNEYSITVLEPPGDAEGSSKILTYSNAVFWDTPDFDSVGSFGYRESVIQALALADLVVFVVSKEKYADKTVWDMLTMLSALSKPVFLLMNKTPPDVREQLADSVEKKYRRLNNAGKLDLFFIDEYPQGLVQAHKTAELVELQSAIAEKVSRATNAELSKQANHFVKAHWQQWTAPVTEDHRVQAQWKTMVDDTTRELGTRYKSEYLEHSRYKETFQLALAELLALLEVPGMAEPLTRLRSVVTWPMRKLIATATQAHSENEAVRDDRSEERRLLEELGEHGLSQLAKALAEMESDGSHWIEVREKLTANKSSLLRGYSNGLDNYQALLQVEIERAAQSLYKKLQEQPATLNSLRAARVTGDAAAVVLAVKSGGLGAADLVIAPAMLSLTSMLTEGALGQYMQNVQNDLRIYQEKEIASLMARKLRVKLYPLIQSNDRATIISSQQLLRVANQLGIDIPVDGADSSVEEASITHV